MYIYTLIFIYIRIYNIYTLYIYTPTTPPLTQNATGEAVKFAPLGVPECIIDCFPLNSSSLAPFITHTHTHTRIMIIMIWELRVLMLTL